MKKENYIFSLTLLMFFIFSGCTTQGGKPANKPGSKIWLNKDIYFTYEFDKRPVLGNVIVKIKIFGKNDARNNDYTVTGLSGMPKMSGAHDSPETAFQQNKKGDYLLPVNVVMPGEWEVKLKFRKKGAEIISETIGFNVG